MILKIFWSSFGVKIRYVGQLLTKPVSNRKIESKQEVFIFIYGFMATVNLF